MTQEEKFKRYEELMSGADESSSDDREFQGFNVPEEFLDSSVTDDMGQLLHHEKQMAVSMVTTVTPLDATSPEALDSTFE